MINTELPSHFYVTGFSREDLCHNLSNSWSVVGNSFIFLRRKLMKYTTTPMNWFPSMFFVIWNDIYEISRIVVQLQFQNTWIDPLAQRKMKLERQVKQSPQIKFSISLCILYRKDMRSLYKVYKLCIKRLSWLLGKGILSKLGKTPPLPQRSVL